MPDTLVFPGVRSARFIGYLHGLALLRVVSEQLDATARGAWSHGSFTLTTAVTREQLVAFFVEHWTPTPVVSPWNGGSGFHPKDKESRDALVAIEESEDPRLAGWRTTVATARAAVTRFGLDGPPDTKVKPVFLQHLRAVLPDAALGWLDASVVIAGVGVAFPPALGTGGNDGRFDLASNNAQCLVELFGLAGRRRDANGALLDGLLDGTSVSKRAMSLGHLVRDVSPVGSPSGENLALANLWDLPLAIEGVVLLAAGTSRRGESGSPAHAAAPFSVRPGAGYGSAVAGESARAEQWMPLWDAPATLAEVRSLLREGRASVGRRRASTGLDVTRAVGELGVARGITAFERFGILERAGLSYVTLHAGTVEVRERPAAAALRGLDAGDWLSRVLAAGAEKPPTALRQAARSLEQAAFAMADRGTASDVERMLGSLGEMELVHARAGASRAASAEGPKLRTISPPAQPWLAALDFAAPAVRAAIALGSLTDGPRDPRLPLVRDLLSGTAIWRGERAYDESGAPLVPAVGSAERRLVALHLRREVDATGAERHGPAFDFGQPASLADLTLLATGQLDTERVLRLAAGVALLNHHGCSLPPADAGGYVSPALATLALVVHHRSLGAATDLPVWRVPSGLIARLASGAVVGVLRDALARLRQAGHPPIATAEDLVAAAPHGGGLALALLGRPRASDLHVALRHLTVPALSSTDDPITHTEQEPSS